MAKFLNLFIVLSLFSYVEAHSQVIDTLISVGNHHLHFKIIKGRGAPILFESGNSDDGTVWEKLLIPLHAATGATLITYDRAGLGKSEIDTLNIGFEQEIKDLEYALGKMHYSKDIFLVSHSFGGFYSILFANRNKSRITGAVCIDVALPCFFTEEWSRRFVDAISEKDWELIHQYKIGLYYVLKDLKGISRYMQKKTFPGKIPVTLVAAGEILPMVKQHEADRWTECLKSFGSLPNHKYVLAGSAGHKVWEDDPDLVIREIMLLYKKVNQIK